MNETYGFIHRERAGVRLKVLIQTRASKTRWIGVHEQMLKMAVCAAPIEGAANAAVTQFLSTFFDISKSSIELVIGQKAKKKTFMIHADYTMLYKKLQLEGFVE